MFRKQNMTVRDIYNVFKLGGTNLQAVELMDAMAELAIDKNAYWRSPANQVEALSKEYFDSLQEMSAELEVKGESLDDQIKRILNNKP